MKPFVTIFTPAYNRAHLLTRLYNSLLNQTNKNFEWLIVDDGSTDNTYELVNEFIAEKQLNIYYYRQNNGGKHIAINKGVELAKGDLFFIVDSDDFLPSNSIERLFFFYKKVENDSTISAIVGKRLIINDQVENIHFHEKEFISNLFDVRYKDNYKGDMAEAIKTSVMKEFSFPVFTNERFCTEAVIWNRMSKKYKCLFFDEFIYNCEYQEGGLTSAYWKLLLNNPKGSLLYFKELLDFPLNQTQKKEALKAYNNIAKVNKVSRLEIIQELGITNFVKIYL